MPRCIYTLREFESADAEHILQNFLGARWASREIVCNEQQAAFGTTIDSALEKALRPIRSLFGTRGGRRDPGPVLRNLQGSDGELYDIEPGFRARLNKPIVKVLDTPEGGRARPGTRHPEQWLQDHRRHLSLLLRIAQRRYAPICRADYAAALRR